MTTLKQIAARAGVSTATVSNVLNGVKNATPETRRKVERAAEALGYQASRMARSLRTGKSFTIGLIIPDLTNPFFPDIAQAIESKVRELGYGMIIVDSHNDAKQEKEAFRLLGEYRVDGIIWTPVTETVPRSSGIPLVTVDRPLPGLDGISADHRAGGLEIGRRVAASGCRRVAILGGPAAYFSSRERYRGVVEGLDGQAEIVVDMETPFSLELPAEVRQAVSGIRDGCVICANDQVAVGVLQQLKDEGKHVPEPISVIGFDAIPWSRFTSPRLTTMRQPYRRLGTAAVDLLLRRMAAPSAPRKLSLLPVEWVEQDSFRSESASL